MGQPHPLGTLVYMSPEQARAHEADARSDVWSLGCVLYELITGEKAFERETGADTMAAILREEPRPLAEFNENVPPELQRIVTRTLQKKKWDRHQTAKELLADLRGLRPELEFRERLSSRT